MKIFNINSFQQNQFYNKANISKADTVSVPESSPELKSQKVYASHLGFKSSKPVSALMNDYKWFVSHDKIPAVESFLKIEAPAESMEALFRDILSDEAKSYELIDSIVSQPRKIRNYAKSLRKKLPQSTDVFNIFSYKNPYAEAYKNYLTKRVQNASSISELLTIRPDWDEKVLLDKHRELYHNDDFELGFVPDCIGRENYQPIVAYLRNYMDIGVKTKKTISDLNINGKNFKFENFVDGKSDKNVFKIIAPNGEAFILKMASPSQKSLNEPFSLGVLAMIDTYLARNNCRNSAHIRYYDHNSNTVIYDFIEHNKVDLKFHRLSEFVEHMPDFDDLGLRQNDTVGSNNYFKLDKNQKAMQHTYDFQYGIDHNELVSVDNDHVTYEQPLCPIDYKLNKPLPCAMQMFF